ncbi:hypothetical protein PF005_g23624 [Phytophthora fragariae]|uniref:Uncharacterized protein n=2 Tax=Phytophthora TaxID=4783 RepID=A0A6A3W7E2_9STRA|nr:hypothetical protein PF003_g32315 [Phytophthora fragariae]KAE9015507.1 hypothetical protein PR002_g13910 [Phytophthora rubi]KAE8980500.1 hypothetical protein PF011_g22413 [Phytophthora fragariae]KAE9075330.1 hypothetical protein PF010_g24344 [Phytophthora fragariae]KAE9179599.1 hypothetical protein PF005_g23624 [Phytophthora fragariae]
MGISPLLPLRRSFRAGIAGGKVATDRALIRWLAAEVSA